MSESSITITLSNEEALVLSDFLHRFCQTDTLSIQDSSEEQVLNNILCYLEPILVEPFQENYGQLLLEARKKIRGD